MSSVKLHSLHIALLKTSPTNNAFWRSVSVVLVVLYDPPVNSNDTSNKILETYSSALANLVSKKNK